MKKVLFATTALVATAGVAAADVTFGGYGRFGVLYNDTVTNAGPDAAFGTADDFTESDTSVTSRFRLQIDATAESDAGVTFGARVRIQQDNDGSADGTTVGGAAVDANGDGIADFRGRQETGINGVRFFARSGGFEVGVGNIFGAIEFMPGQYPIDLGLTGLGYDYTAYNFNADLYDSDANGAAGQNGVEVMYSAGDFSAHLSASDTNSRVAAYVSYAFGDWTVALGGQDSDAAGDTELTASVGGSLGAADVTLAYADNGTNGTRLVLAGRVDVGASTNIEAYIANRDDITIPAGEEDTSYGVDFNMDMGGGTSLRGGVASRFNGSTIADLGVRFNF